MKYSGAWKSNVLSQHVSGHIFEQWNYNFSFFSYPKPLPKLEGPLEPNEELQKAKRLFEGEIVAPESIAVDPSGVVYSGLADGRIVKFVDGKVIDVARTGSVSTNPPCGKICFKFWHYHSNMYEYFGFSRLISY